MVVRLNHQDLLADPLERITLRVAELSAIEPDRVRAETGRQRDLIEHLLIEPPDLHEQLAGLRLPVERQIAVDLLQALGFFGNGRSFSFPVLSACGLSWAKVRNERHTRDRHQKRDTNARARRKTVIKDLELFMCDCSGGGSSTLYRICPATLRSCTVSVLVRRIGRQRPEELKAVPRRPVGFHPGGMPTNFTSGPNVGSSVFGPNVPALSGPATNSQNGSKSVNFARAGS